METVSLKGYLLSKNQKEKFLSNEYALQTILKRQGLYNAAFLSIGYGANLLNNFHDNALSFSRSFALLSKQKVVYKAVKFFDKSVIIELKNKSYSFFPKIIDHQEEWVILSWVNGTKPNIKLIQVPFTDKLIKIIKSLSESTIINPNNFYHQLLAKTDYLCEKNILSEKESLLIKTSIRSEAFESKNLCLNYEDMRPENMVVSREDQLFLTDMNSLVYRPLGYVLGRIIFWNSLNLNAVFLQKIRNSFNLYFQKELPTEHIKSFAISSALEVLYKSSKMINKNPQMRMPVEFLKHRRNKLLRQL